MPIADEVLGGPSLRRRLSWRWAGFGTLGVAIAAVAGLGLLWESRREPAWDGVPREVYEEGVLLGGSDAKTAARLVEERVGMDLPIPRGLLDDQVTLLRVDSYLAPGPLGVPTARASYDIWPSGGLSVTVGYNVAGEQDVDASAEVVDLGIEGVRARMIVRLDQKPKDIWIWAMRDGMQISLRVRGQTVPDVELVKDAMRELMEE
ncbi:MAG: hypothetical protein ACSLFM_14290 [Tepidiformaceae bacterium]